MNAIQEKEAKELLQALEAFSKADAIAGPTYPLRQYDAALLVEMLAAARMRREDAERERDAARGSADDWKVCAGREIAVRARAEADNAALCNALRDAMANAGADNPGEWARLERILMAAHPGAAMLEESDRRRALLEAVAKACRGLGPVTPEVESVVGRALERMQALKTFVQGFAEMAENAIAHHTKPRTGMQVPYHDDFANLPPSGVAALERWRKAAVAALKPETK